MLPRWKIFSNDRFKEMIEADRVVPLVASSTSEFGRNQVLLVQPQKFLSMEIGSIISNQLSQTLIGFAIR